MDPQKREPLTEELKDKKEENTGKTDQTEPRKVPVYSEKAETKLPEADPDELKALALSYARYLAEHDLKPGEPTFTDSEELTAEQPVPEETAAEQPIIEE